jgi:hypothetical protein
VQQKIYFSLIIAITLLSLLAVPFLSEFDENRFFGIIYPVIGAWFCYEAIFKKKCQLFLVTLDLSDDNLNQYTPALRWAVLLLGLFILSIPIYLFLSK